MGTLAFQIKKKQASDLNIFYTRSKDCLIESRPAPTGCNPAFFPNILNHSSNLTQFRQINMLLRLMESICELCYHTYFHIFQGNFKGNIYQVINASTITRGIYPKIFVMKQKKSVKSSKFFFIYENYTPEGLQKNSLEIRQDYILKNLTLLKMARAKKCKKDKIIG